MNSTIEDFYINTGYRLKESNGKLLYDGSMDLSGDKYYPLPENLVINGILYLDHVDKEIILPSGLVVVHSLFCNDSNIRALPNDLIVGGSLWAANSKLESLPENFKVGRVLNIKNNKIKTLPDSLKHNILFSEINEYFNTSDHVIWDNEYIKADDIFTEIVSHRGNVYRVRYVNSDKIFYLVTDGDGKWAHGETLQEARADLVYKISNRDASEYSDLTLDSELSFAHAVECYRVITGACSFGTKTFVESLDERRNKYSIREICELTLSQFGNETFCKFFKYE